MKQLINYLFLKVKTFFCRIKLQYLKNKNCCFYLGSSTHNNIGDAAIALSTRELFKALNIHFIELTANECIFYLPLLQKYARNRVVFFNAGGNMGTLWPNEENKRRKIIDTIQPRKLAILPQTIFYTHDFLGKEKQKESVNYYNNKNVTIFERENISFEIGKTLYPLAKNISACDIVCTYSINLNKRYKKNRRVLLVLRNDREKGIDENYIYNLKTYLIQKGIQFDVSDMLLQRKKSIPKRKRKAVVNKKIKTFAKYDVVITDRLHGMVFSTLARTKCIVLENNNHKIAGVYSYLKKCNNVSLVKDFDECVLQLNHYLSDEQPLPFLPISIALKDMIEQLKSNIMRFLDE